MTYKSSVSHKSNEPESSVLYIVGTPIGNLGDLSIRALNVLKNVALIACEDTRQTKKIMNKYEFKNNLISFNKHNSFKKIPRILNELKSGKSIALVSDAGLPSICDPGEVLIRKVRDNDLNIICIPGPCAALTALVGSGLPSSKFVFEGFLPKKQSEREETLIQINKNIKTTILFESPHRLNKLLLELKKYCGGDREIEVSRELTKIYEERIGNNIDEVINLLKDKEILGEITIVIKGRNIIKTHSKFDEDELKKELVDLVNAGLSLSAAAKYLAKKNKLTKSYIYNMY